MAEMVLVDNDVALKTCCYDAVDQIVASLAGDSRTIHVLGVIRFVLARVISKGKNIANKERTADRLSLLLKKVVLIEPSSEEILLAAQFEETAQSLGLDLDGGESQLLSMLVKRSAMLLLTGDKRAIRAIAPVVGLHGWEEQAKRRVACLEQLAMTLVARYGAETIHQLVCAEEAIDNSLAICFSCVSGSCKPESVQRALLSYITDLRKQAQCVLVESDDLSAVIS